MPNHTVLTVINAFGIMFAITNSFVVGLRLEIGHILAHFFAHWRPAAWALLINFVVLPALIIGFAAIAPIKTDIKIGYCIVALGAGAPFAPAITRLAKGNVAASTALLLAMMVVTVIVMPFLLPLTVSALAPGAGSVGTWEVAWPLLAFVITPLVVGCLMRLRYAEVVSGWVRPLVIIEITSLLLYANLFIYAFSSEFLSVWWGAYLAAVAVPILGIAFGSVITVKDRSARHASVITTAQRSITAAIIVTIFNYTQPLANVSVTLINTTGIVILLLLAIEWGRAQARKKSMTSTATTEGRLPASGP